MNITQFITVLITAVGISTPTFVPNMKELKGKLTVLSGSVKTEYSFVPVEQFLTVSGIPNLSKGSILVATVTGYQGKTLNARFTYK